MRRFYQGPTGGSSLAAFSNQQPFPPPPPQGGRVKTGRGDSSPYFLGLPEPRPSGGAFARAGLVASLLVGTETRIERIRLKGLSVLLKTPHFRDFHGSLYRFFWHVVSHFRCNFYGVSQLLNHSYTNHKHMSNSPKLLFSPEFQHISRLRRGVLPSVRPTTRVKGVLIQETIFWGGRLAPQKSREE